MNVTLFIAHADDETLGAGGLIPKLIAKGHKLQVILASDGHIQARQEGIHNMDAFKDACKLFGIHDVQYLHLEDQYFDKYPMAEISNKAIACADAPDLIITHSDTDLNRDHRIINEAAKIIGRPKAKPVSILGMEIGNTSRWNGQSFNAQLYVDITETIGLKQQAFALYQNEIRAFPYPYSNKGIEVLAQFRGMESGSQYAEAYEVIRLHNQHIQF
jgi:LmbE family N-acetylglucosaminyl deacetylase